MKRSFLEKVADTCFALFGILAMLLMLLACMMLAVAAAVAWEELLWTI